jgi:hypothetical protein
MKRDPMLDELQDSYVRTLIDDKGFTLHEILCELEMAVNRTSDQVKDPVRQEGYRKAARAIGHLACVYVNI